MANTDVGADLAFSENAEGQYDLSLNSNGDFSTVDSFDTALLMSILCERRALESEIPNSFLRRGWWGNLLSEVSNFEIGSKLWLLSQARSDLRTVNLSRTFVENSLAWLTTQNYAQSVTVTSLLRGTAVTTGAVIRVNPNIVSARAYALWQNTAQVSTEGISMQVIT